MRSHFFLVIRVADGHGRHQVTRSLLGMETSSLQAGVAGLVVAVVRLDALNEALRAEDASESQASCQRPSVGPVSGSRRGAVQPRGARGEGKEFAARSSQHAAGGFGCALTGAAHRCISCTYWWAADPVAFSRRKLDAVLGAVLRPCCKAMT